MIPPTSRAKRRRSYQQSGVYTLKKAVATLGNRTMPTKRTALGRELREWRAALVADLGGVDAITTQQAALVDLAVRSKLLVDSVDAYLLAMESPVDKRHRRLWPVVRERQSLVAQLQSLLRDLGLERRAKEVPDLQAYLATKATGRPGEPPAPSTGPHASIRKMVLPPPDSIGGETKETSLLEGSERGQR